MTTVRKLHGAIIHLSPMSEDRSLSLTWPQTKKALAYWRRACGERTMPTRSDIRPAGMREFLAYVALIDIVPDDPRTYRIRVAGTAVEAFFGPLTGKWPDEALPDLIAERWRAAFRTVQAMAVPIRFYGHGSMEHGASIHGEILALPVSEDGTAVSQLLAVLVAEVRGPGQNPA